VCFYLFFCPCWAGKDPHLAFFFGQQASHSACSEDSVPFFKALYFDGAGVPKSGVPLLGECLSPVTASIYPTKAAFCPEVVVSFPRAEKKDTWDNTPLWDET